MRYILLGIAIGCVLWFGHDMGHAIQSMIHFVPVK